LLALIKLACSIPTNAHTYYLISLLKSGSINCTENLPVQPVVSSEARILPLPVRKSTPLTEECNSLCRWMLCRRKRSLNR
jgi:hypothetical protein